MKKQNFKKWLVSLVFISTLCTASYSQSFQWIQSGGGADNGINGVMEKFTELVTDNQGNIYGLSPVTKNNLDISGNPKVSYSVTGNMASALVSYDCAGNYRWSRILSSSDGNAGYGHLVCDSLGNIYVAAGMSTFGVHFDSPVERPCTFTTVGDEIITNCKGSALIKYDTNGVEQWIIYIDGNVNITSEGLNQGGIAGIAIDETDTLYLHTVLNTGTFCNGSYVNTSIGEPVNLLIPNPNISVSRHIIKYNTQGQFIIGYPFNLPVQGFRPKMARNPVNGDFYFAGNYGDFTYPNPPILGDTSTGKISAKYIVAFNSQGNYLWRILNEVANGGITGALTDIKTDALGNIYVTAKVCGERINNLPFTPIETIGGFSFIVDEDCFSCSLPTIIKFNSLGQPLLETHPKFCNSITDNSLIINGNEIAKNQMVYGLRWQDRNIPTPNTNRISGGLVRFNKDTFKLIDINYVPATTSDNFAGTTITTDHLGNYYLGGLFLDQATVNGNTLYSNGGDSDFCLVKFGTNNCNCQVPTCRFATSAGTSDTSVVFSYQGQNVYDTVSWNFGDNSTSSDVNPTHTYATPGVYNVCVTATNSCDSFQFCKLVDTTTLGSETFIEDFSANLEISPNPAFGSTSVTYDATQVPVIEVYDLAGRLITKHEPTLQKGTWQLPLETVAQGMYLVVLTENRVVKMQKKLLVK